MAKQKQIEQKTDWWPLLHTKWAAWVVFAFSALLYLNTIPNKYNMDDELVTINHRLTSKGLSAITEIFTEPYYKDKLGYSYEYRPVVLFSFAIEHQFLGESPHISHFFNVLFYALLCVLLLKLLSQLLKGYSSLIPFLITLIFAAHPIHTEVVASIKNRDELLAVIFGLLAWRSALKLIDSKQWYWLLCVFAAYFTSLYAKQSTSVFLLFIPLSLVFFRVSSFRLVLSVYGVMALALFPSLNLPKISDRFIVVLVPVLLIAFGHILRCNYLTYEGVYSLVGKVKKLFQKVNDLGDEEIGLGWMIDYSVYKQPLFYIIYLIPPILLLLGGLYSIYSMNSVTLYLCIIFLGILFVIVRNEAKLLAFLPYMILLMCAALWCGISTKFIFYNLLLSATLISVFSKNSIQRFANILVVILSLFLLIYIKDFWFIALILVFVGFGVKQLKFMRYGGIGLVVLSFAFLTYKAIFQNHIDYAFYTQFLPMIVVTLFTQFRKLGLKYVPHISLLTMLISLGFAWNYIYYPHNPVAISSQIVKANWETKVGLAPSQMNRPLAFIETPVTHLSPYSQRIGTAAEILIKYAQLVVLPYPMAFYYGYREIDATEWTAPIAIAGMVLYFLFGLLVVYWYWGKEYLLAFGLLFYSIAIFSYTNLFISVPGMMGDRFLFIPSIGFTMLLVGLLMKFFKSDYSAQAKVTLANLAKPFTYILLGVLVVCSSMTLARNRDWKDQLTLFSHDIKTVSESAQAQNLLGIQLLILSMNEQDNVKKLNLIDQSVVHFKKALEIYPKFLNAAYDMGRAYTSVGKVDLAYAAYEQAMQIDTNFVAPCLDMAIYQQNLGNLPLAVKWYERFLSKYPTQKEAYANLSFAYYKAGDFASSIAVNQRAIIYLEDDFEPLVNIGKVYFKIQETDSARYYLLRALQLRPADVNIKNTINALPKQ
jgi:tetratricopeptide (TPR) repeat protein